MDGQDGRAARVVPGRAWDGLRTRGVVVPEARVVTRRVATDGTIKYAIAFDGGAVIETVLIPGRFRSTICVSSQAGCTRRCGFCATATLGFQRALTAGEILAQLLVAQAEAPAASPARNVVFMGMGEPMDNLDEVLVAVGALLGTKGPQLRARHVTVSTSGVLPGIERFLAESPANLALSLNATTEETRRALMPHDKRWPLSELLALLRADQARNPRRTHFIEYVMLDGVNDSLEDAARLVALLDGLPAHVNLIPHNATEGIPYAPSPAAVVKAFQDRCHRAGVRTLIRQPRGQEIEAACGQLARRGSG